MKGDALTPRHALGRCPLRRLRPAHPCGRRAVAGLCRRPGPDRAGHAARPRRHGPPRLHDLHPPRGPAAQGRRAGTRAGAVDARPAGRPACPAVRPAHRRAAARRAGGAAVPWPAHAGRGRVARPAVIWQTSTPIPPPPPRPSLTKSSRRPSPASRAVRRSRRPAPRRTTFLERYRNVLLGVGGIAVFAGLVFVGFIAPGLTPAYACANMFEPTPAPSFVAPSQAPVASGATPAPQVTAPAPGYVEPDMGRLHITPGAKITYTWCPPASGNHYAAGQGPIPAGFYDKDSKTVPGGWVHNLEHGYEVLLYKCPGPGCTDEGQAQLQALISTWPDTPVCHTPPG